MDVFRFLSLNLARVVLVGALLISLFVGLRWALSIEARPDGEAIAAAQARLEASEAAASESAESGDSAGEEADATNQPNDTSADEPTEPAVDPAEFIAAAAQPADTTVQVLDGGGGSARVDAAVSALEGMGYNVINVTRSSTSVSKTTIYFTRGDLPQAEGLRARDPRFQLIEANPRFNESVNLHVVVGDF